MDVRKGQVTKINDQGSWLMTWISHSCCHRKHAYLNKALSKTIATERRLFIISQIFCIKEEHGGTQTLHKQLFPLKESGSCQGNHFKRTNEMTLQTMIFHRFPFWSFSDFSSYKHGVFESKSWWVFFRHFVPAPLAEPEVLAPASVKKLEQVVTSQPIVL